MTLCWNEPDNRIYIRGCTGFGEADHLPECRNILLEIWRAVEGKDRSDLSIGSICG